MVSENGSFSGGMGGLSPELLDKITAAKIANGPGASQNQAYADAPIQELLKAYQAQGGGNVARMGGFDLVPYMNGTFAVNRAGVPGMGASQHNDTAYDIYDAQGNYLGSNTWKDLGTDGVDKIVDGTTKALTAAFIGGGMLGGLGIGPMASSGAGAGTGAGVSGAAFGDAGLMYAGADTAAAATLGGGATVGGGTALGAAGAGTAAAAAGGGAGSSGFSLSNIIKTATGAGAGTTGWASLVAPAMSAVGGYLNYKGAGDAADAMTGAAQDGISENRRQFDKVLELLSPYINAGSRGVEAYEALAGSRGPQAQAAAVKLLQESPEYASLVSEGEAAILANTSATGGLRGGNTQAALAQFRPKMLSSLIDRQLGRYGSLATMGQNSAAGAGTAALSTGQQNANLMQQQGAAQAGGIVAGTNAITNAVGGIGGFFAGYGGPGTTPPNPYAVAQPARYF